MKISRQSNPKRCLANHAAIRAPLLAVAVSTFAALGQLAGAATGQPAMVPSLYSHARPLGFGNEHSTHMSDAADVAVTEASVTHESREEENVDEVPAVAPTSSTFLATWKKVPGAVSYELEIATDRDFTRGVLRYPDLGDGKVNFRIVSELQPATTYFYRVRSVDTLGQARSSETMSETTASTSGLTIVPVYDPSVLNSSMSAQIQATVSKAIGVYQSLFKDPITVKVLFRYSTFRVDGTPIPIGTVSESLSYRYSMPWSECIAALKGDASSESDTTATGSLPTTALSTNITINSANGRAIGLDTPAQPYSPEVANGQPLDAIIDFNESKPLQFSRPVLPGHYDALSACEHEMDEALGFGSHLRVGLPEADLHLQDLFSWSAPGTRNTTYAGIRYLSIDRGVTRPVDFNQSIAGDAGDWKTQTLPVLVPRVQDAFLDIGKMPDVTRSSAESLNLDVIGYDLTPLAPAPSLANISTRLFVQGGDGALIGGFIVTGSAPMKVLVRAIGPSLPLTNALPNPNLELHAEDGSPIASNNDWQSDQRAEIQATGLAPTNNLESAVLATLNPGAYTAVVQSTTSALGVALVEVYDLDEASDSTLGNISTRGSVGAADKVLIGGFIILGGDPTRVLIRALGPSLPVAGTMDDPTLDLHDSYGTTIASNDDWRSHQQTAITAAHLQPPLDQESALVSTLQPGPYTVIVQGKDGATGVALMEVYHLTD